MGIRYYAYAFDNDQTETALADPHAYVSSDPLADAWGMEPHARLGVATMEQRTPECDLLYLDKAWRFLQHLTGAVPGRRARPAHRMFEGDVTMQPEGWGAWIRALTPAEVATIAPDVASLMEQMTSDPELGAGDPDREYAFEYLRRASQFVTNLAAEQRGMVYLIG